MKVPSFDELDAGQLVVPEKPYFQRKMVKKVRVFIQQSVENGF
jgi:hypothetical protein